MKDFPILMADIINSGSRNSNELMAQFRDVVAIVNKKHRENIISPLTITLGDEFQGLCSTMENGINLIFDTEQTILDRKCNFKLRYVLLYGKIETEINSTIAYEMLGEGLTAARNELDLLKRSDSRILIRLEKKEIKKENYLNKAFFIYQKFVDSWKEKDRDIVREFLLHDDYKKVAEKVNIDPSNAWRRKKSLSIIEYKDIKEIILVILNSVI